MSEKKSEKKERDVCPICGARVPKGTEECPECGEELDLELTIEERGRVPPEKRLIFHVGLIVFFIGAMGMIYSPLHDALGLHGVDTAPGYYNYSEFGPLNWIVVIGFLPVLIVGILILFYSILPKKEKEKKSGEEGQEAPKEKKRLFGKK